LPKLITHLGASKASKIINSSSGEKIGNKKLIAELSKRGDIKDWVNNIGEKISASFDNIGQVVNDNVQSLKSTFGW